MSILITLNALSAISKLCEFIFAHSETVPPDVTAMTLLVSPSYVSVRYYGACISPQTLSEGLPGLFSELREYGAESFTYLSIDHTNATRYAYKLNLAREVWSDVTELENNAIQEGSIINVNLSGTTKSEMISTILIWEGLAKLMKQMENPPVLEQVSILLNGEKMPSVINISTESTG